MFLVVKNPCIFFPCLLTCDPSLVQKTEGGGLPSAAHSNLAMPFIPTRWSRGFTRNTGWAKQEKGKYVALYSPILY